MGRIKKIGDKYLVDLRVGGIGPRKVCFTRKEARELLAKVERPKERGPSRLVSIVDAINEYVSIETARKGARAQYEEPMYFEEFEAFLRSEGLQYVFEIEAVHLQKLQTHMLKKVCPGTVNRRFGLFSHFFTKCFDWEWIERDPTMRVSSLSHTKAKKSIWTLDQINEAIGLTKKQWAKDVFRFGAHIGCRDIEACRLQWSDVDFGRGLVTLRSFKGRGGALKTREIPMTPDLRSFLLNVFDRSHQKPRRLDGKNFVFTHSRGGPLNSDMIAKEMCRVRTKMKLPVSYTFYGFRHTLFTSLAEANVSQQKIASLAGHADIRTTQIYTSQVSSQSLLKTLTDAASTRKIQ